MASATGHRLLGGAASLLDAPAANPFLLRPAPAPQKRQLGLAGNGTAENLLCLTGKLRGSHFSLPPRPWTRSARVLHAAQAGRCCFLPTTRSEHAFMRVH